MGITVDPDVHHRGIGTMLYNDLYAFAAQQGVLRLETSFPDHLTESMTFAEKRGFVLNRHIFDSILDLTTFDETPYAGVIEAARNAGFRFFTYADIDDTPENRHSFFRLQLSLMRDVPGFDYPEPPFEQWLKWTFDSSLFVAASQFMAADGENWAGFSGLAYFKDDHIMVNWMTGVQREYRGRNVALALKLQAIEYARQNGVSRIRTNNDSLNAPMLAINRKLGYKPVPGSYRMNKEPA